MLLISPGKPENEKKLCYNSTNLHFQTQLYSIWAHKQLYSQAWLHLLHSQAWENPVTGSGQRQKHFFIMCSYLQRTIQEATVLSWFIAETFAGCYRRGISWSKYALYVPPTHRKVISFPRHLPVSAVEHTGLGWQSTWLDQTLPFFHQNSKLEEHPIFFKL